MEPVPAAVEPLSPLPPGAHATTVTAVAKAATIAKILLRPFLLIDIVSPPCGHGARARPGGAVTRVVDQVRLSSHDLDSFSPSVSSAAHSSSTQSHWS